jgi:hypothetical protein
MTQNEIALLLAFQKYKIGMQAFPGVLLGTQNFHTASEDLRQIKDTKVAKLVRKFLQPNPTLPTRTGCSPSMKIAEEIWEAEEALYILSFQYGDTRGSIAVQ